MVALMTKGADPDLGVVVDRTERVQNRAAGLTTERSVGQNGHWVLAVQWRQKCCDRDHALARVQSSAWPHVPCHADAIRDLCVDEVGHDGAQEGGSLDWKRAALASKLV